MDTYCPTSIKCRIHSRTDSKNTIIRKKSKTKSRLRRNLKTQTLITMIKETPKRFYTKEFYDLIIRGVLKERVKP